MVFAEIVQWSDKLDLEKTHPGKFMIRTAGQKLKLIKEDVE